MSDGSDSDDTPPTFVRLEDENSDDDPEWEDPSGGALSSILDACERGGNAEALSALLGSLDVSVDTKGADGDTPLHVACLYGHADIVRALLEKNADPRVTDGDGGTPLHDASAGGHLNIVKMLVERIREIRAADAAGPADVSSFVNARDGDGETPLHLATRGEHGPVVTFLLSHGARVEIRSDAGLVAREYATEGGALYETLRAAEASKAPRTP
jgi:ankyrin repeat protein